MRLESAKRRWIPHLASGLCTEVFVLSLHYILIRIEYTLLHDNACEKLLQIEIWLLMSTFGGLITNSIFIEWILDNFIVQRFLQTHYISKGKTISLIAISSKQPIYKETVILINAMVVTRFLDIFSFSISNYKWNP